MESLALLVALIFYSVAFSGPVAILTSIYINRPLGAVLGALALIVGAWWSLVAQWGINYIGVITAVLGIWAICRAFR